MGDKIRNISAAEIMAERGTLALEVTVTTEGGATGSATPTAGVSASKFEKTFVVDGGKRFGGRGLTRAIENVEKASREIIGIDVSRQYEIDRLLIATDGTKDRSNLGANVITGISQAVCDAAANSAGLPLYKYLGGATARYFPMPILGICLCGRYRDPGKTRWLKPSYEYVPYGATGFESSVEMTYEAQREFKRIIIEKCGPNVYRQKSLKDSYDAFFLAGAIEDDRVILDAMTEAVITSGNEGKIGIYFDAAAGCYYEPDIDRYVGIYSEGEKDRKEMTALYKEMVANYPLISLEDPLHEEDYEGTAALTEELNIEIVGDDLFTTNIERLKEGVAVGAANSMVIKITQVGTLTEALEAVEYCKQHNYNLHPCGSRGDWTSILDIALGLGAGQVRGFDWRRMREIEQDLGDDAIWPGKGFFKTGKQS
jgi:enolase